MEEIAAKKEEQLYLDYNNSGPEKKTMSTQVDYVSLIIARNNDDAGQLDKYEEQSKILADNQATVPPFILNHPTITTLQNEATNKSNYS